MDLTADGVGSSSILIKDTEVQRFKVIGRLGNFLPWSFGERRNFSDDNRQPFTLLSFPSIRNDWKVGFFRQGTDMDGGHRLTPRTNKMRHRGWTVPFQEESGLFNLLFKFSFSIY